MAHTHKTASPEWDHLLTKMIQATQEAILDTSYRKVRHTVEQGKAEKTGIDGSRYTFLLKEIWESAANTRIHIQLDPADSERMIAGTILSRSSTALTFVTEAPLPEHLLKRITFFDDNTWLLERLRDALIGLQTQGETPAQMGAKTLGLAPAFEGYGVQQAQIATFLPNADQAKAIALGMESESLLVIGPPGTGKTATESVLVLEYLLAGKTVLLTAYTNKALDTAMKRVHEYCKQSGNMSLIQNHQLVRLGTPVDLDKETYQDIALQGIVDQQLGALALERDRLQKEQSELGENIARCAAALDLRKTLWREQHAELQALYEAFHQERASLRQHEQYRLAAITRRLLILEKERRLKQQQQEEEECIAQQVAEALLKEQINQKTHEQALQAKHGELIAFRTRSLAGRFFAQILGTTEQTLVIEEQQCQEALKQTLLAITEYRRRQDQVSCRLSEIMCQIDQLNEEEQRLLRAQRLVTNDARRLETLTANLGEIEGLLQQGEGSVTTAEKELKRLRKRSAQLAARLEQVTSLQHGVTLEVLKQAKLIGTTLTGVTTSPYLRDRLFDAVIIDEVSMASLALVLVTAAHATRHVAVFGDPTQLAPIFQLTGIKPLAAYWLGTDLFAHRKVKLEDADTGARHVVFLSEQTRMLPAIAEPLSRLVYGGRLKTRLQNHRTPLQLAPYPEWPLMLIDTSDVDQGKSRQEARICRTRRPPRSSSKYNLYHVRCVVQLITKLLTQLPRQEEPQIGVVTPYGAQKMAIRKALQARGLLHLVHVGTVHDFQSVEYPCIIFDTVEGYGVPIGKFTSDIWGCHGAVSSATRLLNVAHSRAQDKLIYIANVEYIQQGANRKEHLLRKLIDYVDEQGHMDSSALYD